MGQCNAVADAGEVNTAEVEDQLDGDVDRCTAIIREQHGEQSIENEHGQPKRASQLASPPASILEADCSAYQAKNLVQEDPKFYVEVTIVDPSGEVLVEHVEMPVHSEDESIFVALRREFSEYILVRLELSTASCGSAQIMDDDTFSELKLEEGAKLVVNLVDRYLGKMKVLIWGDCAIGKTSLFEMITRNGELFEDCADLNKWESTHGHGYEGHQTYMNEAMQWFTSVGILEVELWYQGGQEGFEQLRELMYPESDLILLCHQGGVSLSNIQHRWVPEVEKSFLASLLQEEHGDQKRATMLLVGLRNDRPNFQVPEGDLARMVKTTGMAHQVQTSSRTGEGITELMGLVVQQALVKHGCGKINSHDTLPQVDRVEQIEMGPQWD